VIFQLNFEEIKALQSGGRALTGKEPHGSSAVLAPPKSRALVQALLPRLEGDLSMSTLDEIQAAVLAVDAIVEHLRLEMEKMVLSSHAADESAVAAYFDFAHALTVAHRLRESSAEMEALVELVTGHPADAETRRSFRFPD
jgi:hypothetical protein